MSSASDVIKMIKDREVKWADLRFTDTRGKEQHVTIPAKLVDDGLFRDGKMFDGSSIAGWKGINESDMILMPEAATAVLDPFFEEATVNIRCDVIEPATMQGYERDPRSIGKRAEAYLKSTGIADGAMFGPENEFFIFDSVRWKNEMHGCSTPCRAPGTAIPRSRAATKATVPASRVDISPSPPSMRTKISATRCAGPVKNWVSSLKCITTKWRPAANAKSASGLAAWSRRPTKFKS
jgi:glutamine synthetase